MSQTQKEIRARFDELAEQLDRLDTTDENYNDQARAILAEMNKLVDANDRLREREAAERWGTLMTHELTEEILKHEDIGRGLTAVCKCGYIGKGVSKKNDFQKHLAESLVAEGWRNTLDPYVDPTGQHPGEDWT